jgi:Mce-associated membrane protein
MWRRAWVGALAVLGLLAAGTAGAAQQDNQAFVDAAATQTVLDQASSAIASVFSYDYRKLDDGLQLAKSRGTDAYVAQYTDLLNKLRPTATKQKQSATTKVVGAGVRELHADSAKLVVFYDQTITRGDTNKTATAGLAAEVVLKLVAGVWKLDSMNSFDQ